MSKVYVYRGKDDRATIYFSKEFVEERNIPVFEYESDDIPEGTGVLKTDGTILYYDDSTIPEPPTNKVITTDDVLNTLLGVTANE